MGFLLRHKKLAQNNNKRWRAFSITRAFNMICSADGRYTFSTACQAYLFSISVCLCRRQKALPAVSIAIKAAQSVHKNDIAFAAIEMLIQFHLSLWREQYLVLCALTLMQRCRVSAILQMHSPADEFPIACYCIPTPPPRSCGQK